MCDDEPPVKRSKYNLRSDSKHRKEEVSILESIRPTKLPDLNEDCFNEIFRHLNVIDLCYVSRVCKQFQQLAKSYFKRKYCDFDFSTLFQGRLISNEEARDVLCAFGPMITSMSIQIEAFHNHAAVGHVEERILNDVSKYCSKELNTLKLTRFRFTSRAVAALNLLSRLLRKLTLDGSVFVDCVFHLTKFFPLTRLILANFTDCYALMETFPNLNTLELIKVSIPSQYILHHFIVRHSQLKTLNIYNSTGVSSAVFRFVAEYGKNLRTFHFYENSINPPESPQKIQENFLQLSELRNLNDLALMCYNLPIGNLLSKMVKNKISLKKLHISKGLNDDQTIDAIVQMKYLEELIIYRMNGLNGEHLIKCAKGLTRLKKLKFCLVQDITAVTVKEVILHTKQLERLIIKQALLLDSGLYNDILDIVKERRNGVKLELDLRSGNMQVLVPQITIQANENWLTIKQTRN